MSKVNAWSGGIDTLQAAVDFKPTTGSIYSGVIKEYHDVPGFVLLQKPANIRIIGQAPVVRTEIFDMVANAQEFRVSVPPKNKFITGKTNYEGHAQNALENLRPQHILSALLIPPINANEERYFAEETQTSSGQYYILTIVAPGSGEELDLKRKVWIDRSDLNVSRLDLYGDEGSLLEEVQYAGYRNFQGIQYPTQITIDRPADAYTLAITIQSATFNRPIPAEKFVLKKPPNAELIELGGTK